MARTIQRIVAFKESHKERPHWRGMLHSRHMVFQLNFACFVCFSCILISGTTKAVSASRSWSDHRRIRWNTFQKNGGRARTQVHVCTEGTIRCSGACGDQSGNEEIKKWEERERNHHCHQNTKRNNDRTATPHYLGSVLCTKEGRESAFQSRNIKKLWFIRTVSCSATRPRRNVRTHYD